MKRRVVIAGLAALTAGCAVPAQRPSVDALIRDVTAAEVAFAQTMADRDHAAFMNFVSDEAVFINGGRWRVVFDNGYNVCDCSRQP